MKSKEETALIEKVMESAFEKMHNPSVLAELIAPEVSDYDRGKIAGQMEMLIWIAGEFNPQKVEEVEDETGLDGQTLD